MQTRPQVVGLFLQLIRADTFVRGFLGSVDRAVTLLVRECTQQP